jgi:adenine-specific DNA-methyltransferase
LIAVEHEYILCFSKNSDSCSIVGYEKSEDEASDYTYSDEKQLKYRLLGLRQRGGAWKKEDRPAMYYPIYVNPSTGEVSCDRSDTFKKEVYPKRPNGDHGRWTWGKEKFKKDFHLLLGKKVLRQGEDDFWDIFRKDYLYSKDGDISTKKPKSIWEEKEVNYQNAKNEIKKMFNNSEYFDFPKPTFLIQKCIKMMGVDEQLILDFFSGSSTTAHAVMQLNAEDRGSSRYIMVQLPEHCDPKSEAYKAGYKNIADIGKERIRRAAKNIKEENPEYNGDLGFKVFKLASSNIKTWNPDRSDLEKSLLDYVDHLKKDRSEQDILYELLLKRGVDLATAIETKKVADKNLYSIDSGKIITCLDDNICGNNYKPIADAIIAWQKELKKKLEVKAIETHVFFKDSAFANDVVKTNMVATLSQGGIEHVRSL